MYRHGRPLALGLLLVLLIAIPAFADEEVFITEQRSKILKVDFEGGTTEVVVEDPGKHFFDLSVRASMGAGGSRIIAASERRGGQVRIYDADTGVGRNIKRFLGIRGVGLGVDGSIFAVNKKFNSFRKAQVLLIPKEPGCPDVLQGPFMEGCRAGGYGRPTLIDRRVKIDGRAVKELVDVVQAKTNAPGLFSAGDLIVLSKRPRAILVYSPGDPHSDGLEEDHHPDFESCNGRCEPHVLVHGLPYKPTGLDIAGDSILVSTHQGVILRVSAGDDNGELAIVANGENGHGHHVEIEDFFTLPGKGDRIAVGAADGTLVAYATVPKNKGKLLKIDAFNGSELDRLNNIAKKPMGVGTESGASVVAAPAGSNIEVLLPNIESTFTNILEPGLFEGECKFYDHPDPTCEAEGTCGPILVSDLDPELPDVWMDAHFQPFRVGNPETGPLQILICRVSTTATILDIISMVNEEADTIGYDPQSCETFNEATSTETRMAWAPIPGEDAPIVEGDRFIGITSGCGFSHRGFWKSYSLVAPVTRDTRPTDDNIRFKQENLGATFLDVKDEILGECNIGDLGGGPVPQNAFNQAGLGNRETDWAYVGTTDGAFGASEEGGNGFLSGGGVVAFEVRKAAWRHEFGTAIDDGEEGRELDVIIEDSSQASGFYGFSPSEEPYYFYFKNISGALSGHIVYSDGLSSHHKLEMAIYRSMDDPREFALFFDDGGAGPDKDFQDLIVTATGDVEDLGTQCQLQLAIAAGDASVFSDCNDEYEYEYEGEGSCEIDYHGLIDSLVEIVSIVDENPDDFLDPEGRNTVGELKARAGAQLFQACKPIGGDHPSCPVQPLSPE